MAGVDEFLGLQSNARSYTIGILRCTARRLPSVRSGTCLSLRAACGAPAASSHPRLLSAMAQCNISQSCYLVSKTVVHSNSCGSGLVFIFSRREHCFGLFELHRRWTVSRCVVDAGN